MGHGSRMSRLRNGSCEAQKSCVGSSLLKVASEAVLVTVLFLGGKVCDGHLDDLAILEAVSKIANAVWDRESRRQ